MSGYRNLREVRLVPIVLIFLNLFAVVIFYLKKAGLNYNWLNVINETDFINIGTFLLLFVGFLILTNIKVEATEEVSDFINKKLSYMNYLNIIYLIIVLIAVRDKIVMMAAFNIEVYLLAIYLTTRNMYAERLRYVKGECEHVLKKQESSVWWRWKIWINPYEKVKFSERLSAIKLFDIISIIIVASIFSNRSVDGIIFLLLIIRPIAFILELIIPVQTSICGICTDIVEKSESKSSRIYYAIYITDYEKKREYILYVRDYPYISSGQKITVVHGAISKRAIYVKEMNLDIR
ncbi:MULTISPECIES: hypothetical protein [Clostridium]|jgi:hypothetical protein|uniref:Uncharacterized protein n=1 Tax=Clostridium disporicum TaxID=84024 RepID=A0A174A052_9CLOT|nr:MULTISPECIES: hypothetical protein [Clostridium]MBX9184386.1 hypothetical protein [Clostridium sp. K04]MDU3521854.1 hypothetical protein [Clostridium saudiense]MDU7454936.1 hypothetical protein [Clostridium saudiense]CUN81249.1 Uncharacterised protein [Clostridium disporicum]CUO37498.1 Uncharacterised protein [Clostridium disporicum]